MVCAAALVVFYSPLLDRNRLYCVSQLGKLDMDIALELLPYPL